MFIIASDHGGLELKEAVRGFLAGRGIAVLDLGTLNSDSVDYPDFGEKAARAGMSIVANKFPGVRAALATDEFTARMSKEHNNANILVMGGRVLTPDEACRMVGVWLDTSFEGGRHQRRLDKIVQIEEDIRAGRI